MQEFDPRDMEPGKLCMRLDELCRPYWFTYSGRFREHACTIHVFENSNKCAHIDMIAKFDITEDNPLEYVVTKILLQFSGGTVHA